MDEKPMDKKDWLYVLCNLIWLQINQESVFGIQVRAGRGLRIPVILKIRLKSIMYRTVQAVKWEQRLQLLFSTLLICLESFGSSEKCWKLNPTLRHFESVIYLVWSAVWLGFPKGSSGKEHSCQAGDLGLIPGLGRFPGGGHVNPLSILAWRLPWTEEFGRLQSIGLQRIGHDWSSLACKQSDHESF